MFLGTYSPRLDEKGRLTLPSKFRSSFEDGMVMTKGQEHCIYVFTVGEFASLAAELDQSLTASAEVRAYNRTFFASAQDDVPDSQGRVMVPPRLRLYAGIDRELSVIGAANHIEIWDGLAWEAYVAGTDEQFSASGGASYLAGEQ